MNAYQNLFSLVGRILLALLFVMAGFGKMTGFEGTVGYIASKGLPLPSLGAIVAIVIEFGVGLAFGFGFKTRLAAIILAVFTVVTGLIFHNFWAMPADQVMINQIMFLKNLAISGGFLFVAAFGAGAYSLDAKLAK